MKNNALLIPVAMFLLLFASCASMMDSIMEASGAHKIIPVATTSLNDGKLVISMTFTGIFSENFSATEGNAEYVYHAPKDMLFYNLFVVVKNAAENSPFDVNSVRVKTDKGNEYLPFFAEYSVPMNPNLATRPRQQPSSPSTIRPFLFELPKADNEIWINLHFTVPKGEIVTSATLVDRSVDLLLGTKNSDARS